jgi:hypothetical protein
MVRCVLVNLPPEDKFQKEGKGTTMEQGDMIRFVTSVLEKLPRSEPCKEQIIIILVGPRHS